MSAALWIAVYLAGFLLVWRGWFLLVAGRFQKDFGRLGVDDVLAAALMAALMAAIWPVSGIGLAIFVIARKVLENSGQRFIERVNDYLERAK